MQIHKNPPLNIVLYEPQIPPNTGNIARLCAATKCHLILIGKLGFDLTNKQLKRAGLDYWQWVSWEHFSDAKFFLNSLSKNRLHFYSVHVRKSYLDMNPSYGDYLFFGKETSGLPKEWLSVYENRSYKIPIWENKVRSLNLGNSVAIVTYDALRKIIKF